MYGGFFRICVELGCVCFCCLCLLLLFLVIFCEFNVVWFVIYVKLVLMWVLLCCCVVCGVM